MLENFPRLDVHRYHRYSGVATHVSCQNPSLLPEFCKSITNLENIFFFCFQMQLAGFSPSGKFVLGFSHASLRQARLPRFDPA